jgi:hypothetical protein
MGVNINKKTAFGPEGFLIARNNPDGTPASPDRILGFYGTVDLSAYSPQHDAYLGCKIDAGAEDVNQVDWTAAVDKSAVTVAEMVSAINAAGFTDITAAPDTATSRLLITYTGSGSPTFLQIFSVDTHPNFAAELDFGQGQTFGGEGVIYYEAFDNTRSLGLPKNIKDSEEIENEAGDGTLVTVIIPAILKGVDPVITTTDNDFRICQLIQGGTWTPATSTYTPPLSSQTDKPIFSIHLFSPIYNKGSNQREDEAGYLYVKIPSVTGLEGDETFETKTTQEILYNCKATEYEDENDVKQPFYVKQNLSSDEFTALDVENIEPSTDIDT